MVRENENRRFTTVTTADARQAQRLLDTCYPLFDQGRADQAADAAEKAIALVPHLPDPYMALAEAMVFMNQPERAIEAYDQACQRTHPKNRFELLKGRAWNKNQIGDHIGVVNDITEMIAIEPGHPACYTRRGISRSMINDFEGAIEDFEQAAKLTEVDADLHNLLGQAYSSAALWQISHPPANLTAASNKEDAHQKAQKALHHFDQALELDHEQAHAGLHHLEHALAEFDLDDQ